VTAQVYIDRFQINRNRTSAMKPVVIVRRGAELEHHWGVAIDGPSRLVYRPEEPLEDGTTAWVETDARIRSLPRSQPTQEE